MSTRAHEEGKSKFFTKNPMELLWLSLNFDASFPCSQGWEVYCDRLQNSCYQNGGNLSTFIDKLLSTWNSERNILCRTMCRRLWALWKLNVNSSCLIISTNAIFCLVVEYRIKNETIWSHTKLGLVYDLWKTCGVLERACSMNTVCAFICVWSIAI